MVVRMQRATAKVPQELEGDILRVLVYFDVFRFPLTPEEIFRFLPSNSITVAHVERALGSPTLRSRLRSEKGYYFLASSSEFCANERLEKERRARRMLVMARIMASIIRTFPFVRAVFLSGELSKGIASKHSDIDFVVVTQEQRLWIARTLLILFKKLFLLNRKRLFCINHMVSEHHLRAEVRNLYSATEVATVRPLENDALYERYVLANLWVLEYFPNWQSWKLDDPALRTGRTGAHIVQRCLESMIPDRIARPLDRWLMSRWQRIWHIRYAHLPEEERSRKFHCSEHLSTAYGEDYQQSILHSFQHRLKMYALIP
jgi:hypothetical protein